MARKYSAEIEKKIIENYRNGISPYEMVKTIPELIGKRPSVIYGVLKRLNEPVRNKIQLTDEQIMARRKYTLDDSYFNIINTEHKAYWLGFIYADGYVVTNQNKIGISLSMNDRKHLEKFKNDIKFTGDVKDYEEKEGFAVGNMYSRIIITSKKMKNDLLKLGVYENKTEILKFPNENQVPVNLIWHFIRGYFDGDGSLTYGHMQKCKMKNYSIKITGTLDFVKCVQKIFNTNVKEEQRHPERNVDNYSISIGGNIQVKKILDNLYKDSTIFLERKNNRYKQLASSMANATENHG